VRTLRLVSQSLIISEFRVAAAFLDRYHLIS
jgi:hypothetical protein